MPVLVTVFQTVLLASSFSVKTLLFIFEGEIFHLKELLTSWKHLSRPFMGVLVCATWDLPPPSLGALDGIWP